MAENIKKVYPGGVWYNDSDEERYARVMCVMNRFKSGEYDSNDVNWFLKNAIIYRVYFSEEVFQSIHSKEKHYWRNPNNKELQEFFTEIEKVGYASYKAICLRKHFGGGLRFEHVVPFNLVIERLDELNRNGELSFDRFMQIKSKLNICIITEDENRRLDKYRQHFPNDVDWENGNEFARYDTVGIDIHGR